MVGFRAFVADHAGGLHGTVSNRPDGSVRCVVEGSRPAVDQLVALLHEGPTFAHVESVDVVREAFRGDLPPFTVGA
jgi:acylphosphatase